MLTSGEVTAKIEAFQQGHISAKALADWAAKRHAEHEAGALPLEHAKETLIFDTLIELIHNEDDPFTISDIQLSEMVRRLGHSSDLEAP